MLRVEGSCNACAGRPQVWCCRCITYTAPRWVTATPLAPGEIRRYGEIAPVISSCPELDLTTRKCKIYETRPQGCRNFPTVSDFVAGIVPNFCSYKLVDDGGKETDGR